MWDHDKCVELEKEILEGRVEGAIGYYNDVPDVRRLEMTWRATQGTRRGIQADRIPSTSVVIVEQNCSYEGQSAIRMAKSNLDLRDVLSSRSLRVLRKRLIVLRLPFCLL